MIYHFPELKTERDDRDAELHSLRLELDGLRSQLEATGTNHSEATKQLTSALKERENAFNKLKEDHEASKASYEIKIADAQLLHEQFEQKVSELTSELAKTRRECEQNDHRLQETATKFKATKADDQNKIDLLQKELDEARSQTSESKDQLAHIQHERDELQQSTSNFERELATCRSDMHTLQEKVSTLQTSLEQSRQDLTRSDEKLVLTTKEREETETNLRNEVGITQTALSEAQVQISDLQTQLLDAKKEGEALLASQSTEDELQRVREQLAATEAKHEAEVKQLRTQIEDSESRLARQLDAFNTIRGELTTVRERQLDREDEIEQQMQARIDELQEDLEEAYEKRKLAEDKLAQNGLSPVSERGFWVSDDGQTDTDISDGEEYSNEVQNIEAMDHHRRPMLGRVPPLQKPRFSEFHHVPQCNGCISEAFDI